MAQGHGFSGSAAKRMSDENTKVYRDGAWKLAKQCCYWNGSAWVDILYHAPQYPPVGTELFSGESYRVKHYTLNKAGTGFAPKTLITEAGYSLDATLTCGRKCKITFRRSSSENTSYWFNMGLYRGDSYHSTAEAVWAGTDFSFTVACSDLDAYFYLAWVAAPDGSGGEGREFNVSNCRVEIL